MATVTERPRARRYGCPRRPQAGAARGLTVVRFGPVWEVRDAYGVVSWADSLDGALAEALLLARLPKRRGPREWVWEADTCCP